MFTLLGTGAEVPSEGRKQEQTVGQELDLWTGSSSSTEHGAAAR